MPYLLLIYEEEAEAETKPRKPSETSIAYELLLAADICLLRVC
jgi:hypothetical protein